MSQFLGFGSGKNGVVPTSGTINTYAAMTATAGDQTVTTALAVSTGDFVLLHQTQHASAAGTWELVQVLSTGAGTFEAASNLVNSYSSLSQAVLVPQYSSGTISGTITATAWNGTVGGILCFLASGTITVTGTISAVGKGFRGATSHQTGNGADYQGEGTAGAGSTSQSANGNGGGGGENETPGDTNRSGAGGGGNGTVGTNGSVYGSSSPSSGGNSAGTADLTTIVFGGGGGDWNKDAGVKYANGGNGGGIIFITGTTVTITGSIISTGLTGDSQQGGGGGGGAGGSILVKAQVATLGTNLITATGGAGGTDTSDPLRANGGAGGVGRIRVEVCSRTGTTNPSASESVGGFSFCGSVTQIIG